MLDVRIMGQFQTQSFETTTHIYVKHKPCEINTLSYIMIL